MSRRLSGSLTLALGLALVLTQPLAVLRGASPTSAAQTGAARASTQQAASSAKFGDLPLAFELNEGQDRDPTVQFLAHGGGYSLALTPSQALLALNPRSATPARPNRAQSPTLASITPPPDAAAPARLGMAWLGANPHPVVTGEQPLPGTVNYFLGNDPAQWQTNIPTYQQVRLHNVYPGIDLVYYGTHGQLEYDFVVAPGADPSPIALSFSGANRLGVDLLGNLSLSLPGGAIAQQKPLVYQTAANGARHTVAGGYTLSAGGHVGFALGVYNRGLPLVIDPAYQFSTYLGGSGQDWGYGIAVDSSGNVYVTGTSASTDFPTVNALQASLASTNGNAFVSKLNATGSALVYSTYLGGTGGEWPHGVAVDSSGNAYVTGQTYSTDFPTTPGAFQTTLGGTQDAFVSKLSATGSALAYSTYLGGSGNNDSGYGIAVDSSGAAYVAGMTDSSNFPTGNPFQSTYGGGNEDAFVSKLNAAGSGLLYSTFLGGSGEDRGFGIALDGSDNTYITGYTQSTNFPTHTPLQASNAGGNTNQDAFVTKLSAVGNTLVYSTYLGGSTFNGGSGADVGYGVAVDNVGNAYITGESGSYDFPVVNQIASYSPGAFVTKVNAAGSALAYSTFISGSIYDEGDAIAVDNSGNAYVTGYTRSLDHPTHNPVQHTLGGDEDAFVTKLSPDDSVLLFSTFLGGSFSDRGSAIAVDSHSNAYVAGFTFSTDFPTSNALYPNPGSTPINTDAFVTKVYTGSTPTTTGVFRPSNGALYLKNANSTGVADIALYYGKPGDLPVTGDWTRKGYKSIGIYRNGTFYLRNSNTTGYADIVIPFGKSGDIPVAGDWTAKGYDSIGVYRPSNHTFYLRNSNTAGPPDITARFGASSDVPFVGDFDGNGIDTIGVYRPSTSFFYFRFTSTSGPADVYTFYGAAGDKPVIGDWDGDGFDSIGVDRNGNFLLRNDLSPGPANVSFYLGVSGDVPIAGPWQVPSASPPPAHQPTAPATHHPSAAAATPTRRGGR